MTRPSRGARPAKVQEWSDRLARLHASRTSVADFCRAESVSPASLYRWQKQLAKEPGANGTSANGPHHIDVGSDAKRLSHRQHARGSEATRRLMLQAQRLTTNAIPYRPARRSPKFGSSIRRPPPPHPLPPHLPLPPRHHVPPPHRPPSPHRMMPSLPQAASACDSPTAPESLSATIRQRPPCSPINSFPPADHRCSRPLPPTATCRRSTTRPYGRTDHADHRLDAQDLRLPQTGRYAVRHPTLQRHRARSPGSRPDRRQPVRLHQPPPVAAFSRTRPLPVDTAM